MPLFQVDGWDIKSDKVAFFDVSAKKADEKKKERKAKKDKIKKEQQAKKQRAIEDEIEGVESDEDVEDVADVESLEKVKDEAKEEKVKKQKKRQLSDSEKPEKKPKVSETVNTSQKTLTPLQQKMMAKLTGSRFRWINEQLYTITSDKALELMKEQPQLFDEYHDGFRSQVTSWPENPVDVFVDQIQQRSKKPVNAPGGLPGLQDSKKIVIADMGCGEAQLAADINEFFKKYNKRAKKYQQRKHQVHSFDLKRANPRITVADIRHVPLPDNSCTIVVFCLALMGTNFLDFIKEAYRILAPRGELWIAEIKSRFADEKGDEFVNALKLMGFFHKKTDNENKMFTRFEFFKPPQEIIEERNAKLERRQTFIEVETEKEQLEEKRQKIAEGKWLLKPCIYKRR
ncbi:25S rRNA (adenine645-N1)-methyltransferase TDEL_0A01470 [Torulaspora delbrueckii]|uniref:Ribosomal RNA-processing protein 8 n=1 Tax=Torulaspora delbrueckii TaxID=4950 RepID=G8ZLI5_TORDE|nr:hypothetical protein TDEL_0A01470 [Torulaspora delbrueckii]CCE89479.1 hypothetical protein TDEL_0A01470 [Torulaspora delbrueckii]